MFLVFLFLFLFLFLFRVLFLFLFFPVFLFFLFFFLLLVLFLFYIYIYGLSVADEIRELLGEAEESWGGLMRADESLWEVGRTVGVWGELGTTAMG